MDNLVKIIAFDVETTGIDANTDEIIEIGAVMFSVKEHKNRTVPDKLEEFQSLIKPSKPNGAVEKNHITDEMLKDAPSHAEILPKFKAFCDNANCLVAHNAPFDTGFMNAAYGKHSVAAPTLPIIDSLKISRNLIQLPNHQLITIAKTFESRHEISFKIEETSAHRAVYDCEMLMHILVALLRGRLSAEEWAAPEFLATLKKKDIHQDVLQIKPVRQKSAGFF
jgi:DNA polymerase III epsilon subunit family exonuclease